MWYRIKSYLTDYDISHILALHQSILYLKYNREESRTDMWVFSTAENLQDIAQSSGLLATEEEPSNPDIGYIIYPKFAGEPITFNISHLYSYGVSDIVIVLDRTGDYKKVLEGEIESINLKKNGVPTSLSGAFLSILGIKPSVSSSELERQKVMKKKLSEGVHLKYMMILNLPIKSSGWRIKRIKKPEKILNKIMNGMISDVFKGLRRMWGVASLQELIEFFKLPPYAQLELRPITVMKASAVSEIPEEAAGMIIGSKSGDVKNGKTDQES